MLVCLATLLVQALPADSTPNPPDRSAGAHTVEHAADDVAAAVGRVSVGQPVNGVVEVAGPEQVRLDGLIRAGLARKGDPRQVVSDPEARYFGAVLRERSLLPGAEATFAPTRFEDWLMQGVAH